MAGGDFPLLTPEYGTLFLFIKATQILCLKLSLHHTLQQWSLCTGNWGEKELGWRKREERSDSANVTHRSLFSPPLPPALADIVSDASCTLLPP